MSWKEILKGAGKDLIARLRDTFEENKWYFEEEDMLGVYKYAMETIDAMEKNRDNEDKFNQLLGEVREIIARHEL